MWKTIAVVAVGLLVCSTASWILGTRMGQPGNAGFAGLPGWYSTVMWAAVWIMGIICVFRGALLGWKTSHE